MFGCLGDSGGLLFLSFCVCRMGEEVRGEDTAGLCGEEKSRLKMGVGMVANISSYLDSVYANVCKARRFPNVPRPNT